MKLELDAWEVLDLAISRAKGEALKVDSAHRGSVAQDEALIREWADDFRRVAHLFDMAADAIKYGK